MSLHINRFIDLIKAQESRGGRDITMSLRDAKDLHADITKLLLTCQILQERLDQRAQQPVTIELSGGTFKSD
jgi:hypothetical protein